MHKSVMVNEVLSYLDAPLKTQAKVIAETRKTVIDATLGAGGYSLELLRLGANVLGIEQDPEMLKVARERLESYFRSSKASPTFQLVHGNFKDIKKIARANGFESVSAVVFDLGVATEQLTSQSRGFSFTNPEAILDMRLDPKSQEVMAKDLLNALAKSELIKLFEETCESYKAYKLASRIVKRRTEKPFNTVGDLLQASSGIFLSKGSTNPATKIFLALRIAVNSELANLEPALRDAAELLVHRGKLIVVTFHSKEEIIVKRVFDSFVESGLGKVTDKPIAPSDSEVEENRKARSARMRVFEKN